MSEPLLASVAAPEPMFTSPVARHRPPPPSVSQPSESAGDERPDNRSTPPLCTICPNGVAAGTQESRARRHPGSHRRVFDRRASLGVLIGQPIHHP